MFPNSFFLWNFSCESSKSAEPGRIPILSGEHTPQPDHEFNAAPKQFATSSNHNASADFGIGAARSGHPRRAASHTYLTRYDFCLSILMLKTNGNSQFFAGLATQTILAIPVSQSSTSPLIPSLVSSQSPLHSLTQPLQLATGAGGKSIFAHITSVCVRSFSAFVVDK